MPPTPPFPVNVARRTAAAAAAAAGSTTVAAKDNNTTTLSRHGGSGGSGSTPTTTTTSKLYHPSIFRYTCRGRLRLDNTQHAHQAGTCHGFQTQLEHIDHWRPTTEEEAVQWFQSKAAWADGAAEATAAAASGTASTAAGDQAHALQAAHISNVLVYPSSSTNTNDDDIDKDKPDKKKSSSPPLAKEEWSCYGTTEVDLLVLRPLQSQDETIAAVSPYCAPGMTIRDVTLSEGKDRTSTIRLGILEILYQSSMDADEDDDEEQVPQETAAASTTTSQAQTNDSKDKKEETKQEPRPIKKKKPITKNDADDDKPAVGWPTRFWNSSTNIVKHMQFNAQLLYQATQEDFVGRSVVASERIRAEFPKTLERTLALMRKVILFDWNPPPPPPPTSAPPPATPGGPPPLV